MWRVSVELSIMVTPATLPRVYEKGTREPLDVYQRLVNANFNLNVPRLALMEDFSYLALDDAGAAAFRQFQNDL